MSHRSLLWVVLLAAILHIVGMTRAVMPAQDGLKFIAVARQFQSKPWAGVVRATDRHPLYPALIALAQPIVAALTGAGHVSWRVAAQLVSMLASVALLIPLYALTRSLFDERTAWLACLVYVLLPLPAEIGHDTLSDSLALLCAVLAFRFGEMALRSPRLGSALGCGIAGGCGYLTRPEVLIVPLAVLLTAGLQNCRQGVPVRASIGRFSALAISLLFIVGSYALVKGEVSEKLALRRMTALPSRHAAPHQPRPSLPLGLDDPRWSFAAKEESTAPQRLSPSAALERLLACWTEGLGWIFGPLALWGAWRVPASELGRAGRRLAGVYLVVFSAILVRHATALGYLSSRHTLSMVVFTLPWAAAGCLACAGAIATRLRWARARARVWSIAALSVAIGFGIALQAKPGHPSRWGHWAAGQWLAEHSGPADAVLDTRGWAAFVSGLPSYDYWHVRQALTDPKLAYVVVGADELAAASKRAATLRAVLAYAATPVASFPERKGGHDAGIRVFRFHPPKSWEGLRP